MSKKPQNERPGQKRSRVAATDNPHQPGKSEQYTEQAKNKETHKSENAPSKKPPIEHTRVSRGFKLREDLIKRLKHQALDDDRHLYELMEEAIEQYLASRQAQ